MALAAVVVSTVYVGAVVLVAIDKDAVAKLGEIVPEQHGQLLQCHLRRSDLG
jgi:hypothetical protein